MSSWKMTEKISKTEKFSETIDSFYPKMKKKLKVALKMIPHEERVPGTIVKDVPKITKELKENLEKFKNQHDINKLDYKTLHEANEVFQKEINRTIKFGEYITKKKNPSNENTNRLNGFREIMLKYRKKGFKIPNLSTEKNLFKPSALLLENAELKHFFRIRKGTKYKKGFEEKETFFISKVNNLLYDRLKDLDSRVDPSKYKNLDKFQTNITNYQDPLNKDKVSEISDLNMKTFSELKKEIKELQTGNEILRENIHTVQENYDALNNSDRELKIKSIHPPKKRPKPKVVFEDFIKRLAKPKYPAGSVVENKPQAPENFMKNILNKFNVVNAEAFKPVKKDENGNTIKEKKNLLQNYLGKLNSNGNNTTKASNSIFKVLIGSVASTNFESKKENNSLRSECFSADVKNIFKKMPRFGAEKEIKGAETKQDLSKTNSNFFEKNSNYTIEMLSEKEKLQEAIENHLKNKEFDSQQFRDLMFTYSKKFSHFDPKFIEDLINNRKIEPVNIMKGLNEIKNKIELLDIKENYMDSFLSIGKFEQGATLNKIKNLDEKIGKLDRGLMKSVLKIDN